MARRKAVVEDYSTFAQPHGLPGKLVVIEGIDGCGKSTQVELLARWLEGLQQFCVQTEWSSSDLVEHLTDDADRLHAATPTTFSLLHATDFAHRQGVDVIPPLKGGMVVLADRYVYTAFARDVARGVHRDWARKLYSFAVRPDLVIYLKTSVDMVLQRMLISHQPIRRYEAGMDLNISTDRVESFRVFQSRIIREMNQMADEFSFVTLDAGLAVDKLQESIRTMVGELLHVRSADSQAGGDEMLPARRKAAAGGPAKRGKATR